MKSSVIISAVALTLLSASAICTADSPAEKQAKIRKGVSATLQDLYKLQPGAQGAIQKAAGYAVFKNFGTNVLVVSTASGSGIATNNQTKQETFMKMISAGAGLGVGVKDFRVIFVFETDKAFKQFLDSGWSGSARRGRRCQSRNIRRGCLRSGRSCPRCLRLPDHQERPGAATHVAGHQVLQGRRPEQITDGRLGPGRVSFPPNS